MTARIVTPVLSDVVQPALALTPSDLFDVNHPVNNKSLSGKRAGMGVMIGKHIYVATGSDSSDTWINLSEGGGGSGSPDLSEYLSKVEAASKYAPKTALTNFLEQDALLPYAKKTDLPDVSNFVTASQAAQTYAAKANTDTKTEVDQKIAAALTGHGTGGGMTQADADKRYIKTNGGGTLESSYIDLDQDSGIRVKLTDDQGVDRDVADVIGATDGMNGRIEIGSEKAGLTLNTRGAVEVYDDMTQQRSKVTLDNMANSKKNYVRSGTGHWIDLQPLLDAIAGSGGGTPPDLTSFLTKDEAAQEYLTQALAGTTYLNKVDAGKTFVSKSAADAKYDVKPTGMKDGFLYARATNGYHPLPELRKPVGVMHVDDSGRVTGTISDSYAINILSIENQAYVYQMGFTPKDGDIFILINDGEKTEHQLGWVLPSGTSIKGFHSFNLDAGYELWTRYNASTKEFTIFRENLAQVRGSFEDTKSNKGIVVNGAVNRIVTKGQNADYNQQTGTLTLDMTPLDIEAGISQADADKRYVGKRGSQSIEGELSVQTTNGTFSVRDNGDKVAIGLLHKDSITGEPAMVQADRDGKLTDGRGDALLTARYIPLPPASGADTQGDYALRVAAGVGQYAQWVKIPSLPSVPDAYTKTESDARYALKTDLPQGGGDAPAPTLTVTDEKTTNGHTQEIDFDPKYFLTQAVPNKPNAIAVTMHNMLMRNSMSLGYTAFFNHTQKFVGTWAEAAGRASSRIYPNDVHVFSGENAYITADPISKTYMLAPFDEEFGKINAECEYMVSFTLGFKGKAKDVALVSAYLWNHETNDFVRTTTGEYLAVQTTFSKGENMYALSATGVVEIPSRTMISLHVQTSKPELLEIPALDVSGSGIMFQALTKNFKTGLALMEYMLMTRTDIQYKSITFDKVQGSSHLAMADMPAPPNNVAARTHMAFPDNFQIDATLPAAFYKEGGAICIRPTNDQLISKDRSFRTQYDLGFRLDSKQVQYFHGRDMTMKASILSNERNHWWKAYSWTLDTPTPTQVITGVNEQNFDVVPIDGWTEFKTGEVTANASSDYQEKEFKFTVPQNSKGIAILLMTRREGGTNAQSWFKDLSLEVDNPFTFYDINIATNKVEPLYLSEQSVTTEYRIPDKYSRDFYVLTGNMEPVSVGDIVKNSGIKCKVDRTANFGWDLSDVDYVQSIEFAEDYHLRVETGVYARPSSTVAKGVTVPYSFHWVLGRHNGDEWTQTYIVGGEAAAYVSGGEPIVHYQELKPLDIRVQKGDRLTLRAVGKGSGDVDLVMQHFNPCLRNKFTVID